MVTKQKNHKQSEDFPLNIDEEKKKSENVQFF